jgi:hypothetical protein
MKTTVELPDALMREIKLRAVHEGRKLKDVMADLLRAGLDPPRPVLDAPSSRLGRHPDTGLPVVLSTHPAVPGDELTPERVADILLEQEVDWAREAAR